MNKKLAAECIGTFALVFCGTGAIVINDVTGGAVTQVGIGLTFGVVVMVMIYAIGPVSGAHINPAVTIGFAFSGMFNVKEVFPYGCAQIAGAFLASIIIRFLFPDNQNLGSTLPSGSEWQSFILETILTFLLMFVVLLTAKEERKNIAGIAIGGVVGLEAIFAGPVCGASMNPARSLAPAVVSGNLQSIWIYLAAPVIGALLSAILYKSMSNKK